MPEKMELRKRVAAAARPYYAEPFRDYHDFSHPLEMLSEADAAGIDLSPAQTAAICFHDAVNAAGVPHGTNEQASAGIFRAWAPSFGFDPRETAEAASIILATDHAGNPAPESADVVLDLDLMRLASTPDAFLRHSDGVWREWVHLVPDRADFMRGRAAYFVGFLKRPKIFRTGLFDEGVARDTLSSFVAEWGIRTP